MLGTRRFGWLVVAAVVATGLTVTPGVAATAAPPPAAPAEEAPVVPPYAPAVARDPRPPALTDTTDPAWLAPHAASLPPVAAFDVAVPATGRAHPGSLPVEVGRATSGLVPASVRVRMLDQATVAGVGGRYLGFDLVRTDGGAAPATVSVSVDWSGVAKAFGGDFASRLRLDRVSCAGCDVQRVQSRNDLATHRLTADVLVAPDPAAALAPEENVATAPAPDSGFGPQTGVDELDATTTSLSPSAPTTYALSTSADGSSGSYAASTVSPSDGWNVGLGSGAFTYSYPISVPPPPVGAAPSLALEYSSQSVDGRTVATNNQASQVGEGWSFEPGYIERKFHSCADEGITGARGGNLCYSTTNELFIHFGGQSGELVHNPSGGNEWRIRGNDPSWRILSYSGSSNGDNDGEVFVVITPDGTKYWFGSGTEPRPSGTARPATNAAYTVPVVGNSSNEPCYNAVTSLSWCQQAYRWNLDRILDPNDNVTSLFYSQEINYYARDGISATPYVRAGHLDHVEYGKRNGAEATVAPAQVTVGTALRCAAQTSCPAVSTDATVYPDVPADQKCTSNVSCPSQLTSPTFWSEFELTSLTTWVWNGSSYSDATRYDLAYTFPATGDNTTPSLWLQQITKTGVAGSTPVSLPPVVFGGTRLPNRVKYGAGVAEPMNKYRLWYINTELGGRVYVTYDQPHDCGTGAYPAWNDNPTDCYPAQYQGAWIGFRKYLVTQLVTHDGTGGQPDQTVTYGYLDTPAWHYQDSLLASSQSWTDYRGHASVRVLRDPGGTTLRTRTDYLMFRGMYGDKLTGTTSKTGYTLTDGFTGTTFNDYHYLAGMPFEEKTFALDGTQLTSSLHRYWAAQEYDGPDGWQSHDAQYVRESQRVDRTKNTHPGSSSWFAHETDATYSSFSGAQLQSLDLGDATSSNADTTDDSCVISTYVNNTATNTSTPNSTEWIVSLPYDLTTRSDTCAGTNPVIAKTELQYDGHTLGATPTAGNVTVRSVYASGTVKSVTTTGYDALGRVTSVKTPNANAALSSAVTTTAYTPSTGYPYTGITVTNPLNQTTTTTMQFAWGVPKTVTDANGATTTITSDVLGRTVSVARPGDAAATPSLVYQYDVSANGPSRVTTKNYIQGLSQQQYQLSYAFLDGLGRTIEKQWGAPNAGGAGRRVAVTRYDAQGRTAAESQPFGTTGTAGSGVADPALSAIPFETRYGYDSAGRQSVVTQYAAGAAQWSTTTDYYGGEHVVDSPVHSDVTYVTDVLGRTTRIDEHPSTGTTASASYGYTRLGDLATITDAAGHVTSYTYDWQRRRLTANDPDQGASSTTYDADGNVRTTTDAKGTVLRYDYDAVDRKTAVTDVTTAASPSTLATWTYDTLANGKGRLTSASRLMANGAYTTAVGGYDARGRMTAKTYTFPAGEGVPSPKTYDFTYTYDPSDNVRSVTMPAAGGLVAAETVTTTRNGAGLPVTLTGSGAYPMLDYIADTHYAPDGRIDTRTIGNAAIAPTIVRSYTYDASAGRLATITTEHNPPDPTPIENMAYTYDADSNVRSVRDTGAITGNLGSYECFDYDDLNRLTSAFTASSDCSTAAPDHTPTGAPYDLDYAYDSLGNVTSVTDNLAAATRTYTYNVTGHAHAVGNVSGLGGYTYDANGATLTRPGAAAKLRWDALHRLASVRDATDAVTATFVYDADGNRILRNAGGTTTLYLDGMEVAFGKDANNDPTEHATRYYGNVGFRTDEPGTPFYALLRNNQNSTTTTVKYDAGTRKHRRYTPYGAQRGTVTLTGTDRGFLDKTEDPTGLDAVGARYYDPAIARFTSPDPLTDLTRPQSLAAYSYALGNPTTQVDPSGLAAVTGDGIGGSCTGMKGNCETSHEDLSEATRQTTQAEAAAANATPQVIGKVFVPNRLGRLVGGSWHFYTSHVAKYDPLQRMGAHIVEDGVRHGNGCASHDISECGWLWGDVSSLLLMVVPGAGEVAPALEGGTGTLEAGGTATRFVTQGEGPGALSQVERVGSALKDDVFHRAVSWVVDSPGAQRFAVKGGDGVTRALYQLRGALNGKSGVFEWLLDASESNPVITHQRFIPGGTITGFPNQVP
ncbi:MAG TPA: RHS repeat-associated core domain-containing protein [Mycobacteriales bacterium]|jgi:RHS repeat-associated protein|nr:RHS repeat-associated core domain-containing protein [Mycobacteriales bacterium]